jgi:Rieske 2Fe-2S family protein
MTGPRMLASRYYTDGAIFTREQQRFFAEMWVAAARVGDLTAPGAYVLREVAGESVLITRDEQGAYRGFHNVCRHRGSRLCTEAAGRLPGRIQCPYHGWTYDLAGRLVAAPHMEGAPGFRLDAFPLAPVAVDVWDGHVFVCLHPSPPPLRDQIGTLAQTFAPWRMFELRRAYRTTYDVRANWKLIVQNYSECLHCPLVHPALQKLSHHLSGENEPPAATWLGGRMQLRPEVETLTRTGRLRRAVLPGLPEQERRHVYFYAVLPNLLLSLHPDYVMTHLLWPKAPDRTEVWCEWLFHPREFDRPDFDPADAIDFWDDTNREDWRVSELAQAGIGSRAYEPGPYSPREELLWAFDRIVVDRLGDDA